jgi:anti-anti-sigma factor
MGPEPPFDIQESTTGGVLRLSLSGALDRRSAPILEDRLGRLRALKSPVGLDLSRLESIDSAGIRVLIQSVGDARIRRWPFQIERDLLTPQVLSVFRLMHLERFVDCDQPAVP